MKESCLDRPKVTGFYFVPIRKLTIEWSFTNNIELKFRKQYKPTKEEVFQIIEKLLTVETID